VIIVDAWAPWCRPCKTASQKFEALGEKCLQYIETKRLLLLKDNIDNEDTSHHRSMVDVVPTFFVYIKGQLATMFTGVDFDRLLAYIVQYFATYPEAQSLPQEQEMYQMTPQNNSQEHRREQGREQGQGQGQGREPSVRSMPQIKQNTIQYPPKNI
jgi:thioredoxin-like negative regulator of GroEL